MYHKTTAVINKGLRLVAPSVLKRVVPIVQLLLFVWITYSLVQAVLLNKGSAKKFSNDYCIENKVECALDYNFDKVVYLWVDGVSWDTANPIFEVFNSSGHMNLLRVKHDSAPWSGAVFSTYLTGKVTKNMAEVNADNLVNQFLLNGKKVFLGAKDTIVYVLNNLKGFVDNNKLRFYPGVTSDDEKGAMFSWLFNCDELPINTLTDDQIAKSVNKVLGNAKSEDRSFFLESFFVDHKIHYEVETRFDQIAVKAIEEFGYNLKFIKNWIDNNPEYLLVIVTDHGGKGSPGEPVHGSWTDNNNYAWNLYYNPILKDNIPNYPVINAGDVAATMWQYVGASGISIPAESVGVVAPISGNKATRLKSLKANALQLKANAKHSHLKPGDLPKETSDTDKSIANLEEYTTTLSKSLKEQQDIKAVIIVIVVAFCFQLYVIYKLQLNNFFTEVSSYGFLFIVAPYVAWVMISRWTAGWMWDQLGTENYNIYYYVILMGAVGAAALATSKSRGVKPASEVVAPMARASSASYVSLQVYSGDIPGNCEESDPESDLTNAEDNAEVSNVDRNETVWDVVRDKRVKDVLKHGLEYILGLSPLGPTKPKVWVVWFGVCFGIIGALLKGMIRQSFLGLSDLGAAQEHLNLRTWFAFFILFLEFRWQRRLLTTFLNQKSEETQKNILRKIFNPAFFPMYLKFALYISIFVIIFTYDKSVETGAINYSLPWIVYCIVAIHLAILLFCPSYMQRDLLLPVFALHLITGTKLEQLMTSSLVLCLQPLSNTLQQIYNNNNKTQQLQQQQQLQHQQLQLQLQQLQHQQQKQQQIVNPTSNNKHVVSYLIMIMLATAHFYFYFMENGAYTINELNLEVAGMRDTTCYPKLSVLLIGYHKLSPFIILLPFLVRLGCPNLPNMEVFTIFGFGFGAIPKHLNSNKTNKPSNNTNNNEDYFMLVWNVLLVFGQISVLFFVFSLTAELKDSSFFWTIAISLIVCLYGVIAFVFQEIRMFIVYLFNMLKDRIVH